jgi:2-hydroxychromene-2-carboxylate isomerase
MTTETHARRELEFWFEFASTYSYLSVMRIEPLAASRGVTVVHRPFLLGPIFREAGWSTSPFLVYPQKGAYMWRDMERQCKKFGLSWRQPTGFPRNSLLPMRVATLGVDQPWISDFCKAIMLENLTQDADIGAEACVAAVLERLGLPAAQILDAARFESTKLALRSRTDLARSRGVFGAPTFFVGDEMFWGNDRLEDAIELADAR